MSRRGENMKKLLSFFILSIILLTACSSSNDTAINSIESVLTYQFNGPDPTIISNIHSDELEPYLKKIYSPHFTEAMYQQFIQDDGIKYHLAASDNDYSLEVTDMNIIVDDNYTYDFVLQISIFKNASRDSISTTKVTGRVYFSDEYKIRDIEYYDDSELDEILHIK